MVNEPQENIVWGQRGNFLSVPTDCPQRDERLGWTGDAQVFVRTASFNMDVAAFFEKWMVDVEDAQSPEGAFPVLPPCWGVGTHRPEVGRTGLGGRWRYRAVDDLQPDDTRIVERHYDAMTRWMEYLQRSRARPHSQEQDGKQLQQLALTEKEKSYPQTSPRHGLLGAPTRSSSPEIAEARGSNGAAGECGDLTERIKSHLPGNLRLPRQETRGRHPEPATSWLCTWAFYPKT